MNTTTKPFATTGEAGIAPVVTALQKVWARLQKANPDLPDATIIVKRDSRAWGHTTVSKVWGAQKVKGRGRKATATLDANRYEIMISGENLARGPVAVMGTLLHEAAHAINLQAGVRDVDSNGRHNRKFADTATTRFGLDIREAGWLGWSDTHVPTETEKRWAVEIKMVAAALVKASVAGHGQVGGARPVPPVGVPGKTSTGGRKKNLSRAICECPEDASGWRPSIRASAKVLAIGITCKDCATDFRVTGE